MNGSSRNAKTDTELKKRPLSPRNQSPPNHQIDDSDVMSATRSSLLPRESQIVKIELAAQPDGDNTRRNFSRRCSATSSMILASAFDVQKDCADLYDDEDEDECRHPSSTSNETNSDSGSTTSHRNHPPTKTRRFSGGAGSVSSTCTSFSARRRVSESVTEEDPAPSPDLSATASVCSRSPSPLVERRGSISVQVQKTSANAERVSHHDSVSLRSTPSCSRPVNR